jgi:hypothetical protein
MARIRKVVIRNFRSIASLDWFPGPGVNCLIGAGDSGKTTVLDAIDYCLAARRNLAVSDTDFHGVDVTRSLSISLTLGDLSESLLNLDAYGEFLRGFDSLTGDVQDEPADTLETVMTLTLTIAADLEPVWRLHSERTREAEPRALPWKERINLTPARLGHHGNSNLSWTRTSVLNRVSEERANVGAELLTAARDARNGFGDRAGEQLRETLGIVTATAQTLGVPVGGSAKALLDAHAVSFTDGAISLHSEAGIPLKLLGTGSVRLLIAGLHRAAAAAAQLVLVDEVEHGLEPHRIMRLLDSLGAKDAAHPLQVFLTTHSPVVLRELSGAQLHVVRNAGAAHQVVPVGTADAVQSTMRRDPEAFLARTVLVCEGASEVGLIRGLDELWSAAGNPSLQASAVSYVDTGGGDADRAFHRGLPLLALGYRVGVVLDNDKVPDPQLVQRFAQLGGAVFSWRPGRALEDELFLSMPAAAVRQLLERAQSLVEDGIVNAHIITTSQGTAALDSVQAEGAFTGEYSPQTRTLLGQASRTRKGGWFKSITKMSGVARDIVGPNLDDGDPAFKAIVTSLFAWAHDARA